jgi:spoIIIJ-associated protein
MGTKSNKTKIEKVVKKFLSGLGIEAKLEIVETEEQIDINLETEDTGMVIGYHGDTLEALQLIMSLCIAKELGEFKRVSLEIGGYKKSREEWLNNLAMETKERALSENREVSLRELKSWERRIVHLALKDDESVMSESVGEGKDRMLVVKPR